MPHLRLTPTKIEPEGYRVSVLLASRGIANRAAMALLSFLPSSQDEEDVRWYLEDFPRWPRGMALSIAERVERRMEEIGETLFRQIFAAETGTRDLWKELRGKLRRTRIEVVLDSPEADAIPWELMREPETGIRLALTARSFIRMPGALLQSRLSFQCHGKARILLVISRPDGAHDVGYRSVAAGILEALDSPGTGSLEVQTLRPPTFSALMQTLQNARAEGRPFQILHFDGHGVWEDLLARYSSRKAGRRVRGYLIFEQAGSVENRDFVDGQRLGRLLAEAEVPLVLLNSCRSARAGRSTGPRRIGGERGRQTSFRAWKSLAGELMDAGAAAVVAMAHDTRVETASRFMSALYSALARDGRLLEAVTWARQHLHASAVPVAEGLEPLQDWMTPILYASAPVRLALAVSASPAAEVDPELPFPLVTGTHGRDDVLLALDRAFDEHSVVLLHGQAGGGKTTAVADFARWSLRTDGTPRPILWTSFGNRLTLAGIVDRIGQVLVGFPDVPEVNWLALSNEERLLTVLDLLQQHPVLWVWDNVESVAGLPTNASTACSPEEQRDFAAFLRSARDSKARFLLISRRGEEAWLGDDLLYRVALPPLTMESRWQIARGLATARGARPPEIIAWRPLLEFSQGNPLTLRVLVLQALTQGLSTHAEIAALIARLRTGVSDFEGLEGEDVFPSLWISLRYAIEETFTPQEQRTLSLLHLFQEAVDVDVLWWMGDDEQVWSLPFLWDLTRERGIQLLDRAAEVGLLMPQDDGEYMLHPALPWFFRDLFEHWHGGSRKVIVTAYVEALGELGTTWNRVYSDGGYNAIRSLQLQEENLLRAYQLAREMDLEEGVTGAMMGLFALYDHTGRRAEWQRLVEETAPDFIDSAHDGPRPGREAAWGVLNAYRVLLAEESRDWAGARRLQELGIVQSRREAETALVIPAAARDDQQRLHVHNLAIALQELGEILRESDQPECIDAYGEAFRLLVENDETPSAATCALALGNAYRDVSTLFDLDAATHWYGESLRLRPEHDRLGRARSLGSLAYVSAFRFRTAMLEEKSDEEKTLLFRASEQGYERALAILPKDATDDLRVTYGHLGSLYGLAGDMSHALRCYGESLRHAEEAGSFYWAAVTRYNLAVDLIRAGREQDALEFAQASLLGFERYGQAAEQAARDARTLIDQISSLAELSS
jgi:tetratricopeptide (TPR) repeat protein